MCVCLAVRLGMFVFLLMVLCICLCVIFCFFRRFLVCFDVGLLVCLCNRDSAWLCLDAFNYFFVCLNFRVIFSVVTSFNC